MAPGHTNRSTELIDSCSRRNVADTGMPVPRPRRRTFTPVPEPVIVGIPARLREARDKAGLSTRELADAAGISQATIVNIENDQAQNMSITTLARLADALGVPREWMVFGIVGVVTPTAAPEAKAKRKL